MARTLPCTTLSALNAKPIYIITYDGPDHRKSGRRSTGTFEVDFDRMLPSIIARDIAGGAYSDVDRVYEATPGQSCTDVTESIAFDVLKIAIESGAEIDAELRNWLETHLGMEAVQEAEDEARAWRDDRAEHSTLHRAAQGV